VAAAEIPKISRANRSASRSEKQGRSGLSISIFWSPSILSGNLTANSNHYTTSDSENHAEKGSKSPCQEQQCHDFVCTCTQSIKEEKEKT